MNSILAYFDLNNSAKNPPLPPLPEPAQPAPFGKRKAKRAKTAASSVSIWQQLVFYLGTVVGVLFSSAIMQFQAGKAAIISVTAITMLLAAIIALIIMPFVYKNAIEPASPFIIRLGVFVQAGVFWSVVFTSIGKIYG